MPTSTKNQTKSAALCAIAACSMALTSGPELQLLPAGEFVAIDGRPGVIAGKKTGVSAWRLDDEIAAGLVAAINSRVNDYVIDYEHATLLAKTTGQPAPAAGWYSKVEWRPGVGLFAVDVRWTPKAKQMIDDGEYKYISPFITYSQATGAVTGLRMASLTNDPAIDGMDAVALSALAALVDDEAGLPASTTTNEEPIMEQLLETLRWMLNLPLAATIDDITAELDKLKAQLNDGKTAQAAASCNLLELLQAQKSEIAALSAKTPNPAEFVPVSVVAALQAQLAAATGQTQVDAVGTMVEAALSAGKLVPAMKDWAIDLGKTDMAKLKQYIDSAPAIAALSSTQTGGKAPEAADTTAALTAEQKDIIAAFGLTEKQFREQQAVLGLS